jgi:hypothetical protein
VEKKKAYEWVIVMSKGDDIFLTEKQYEYYLEHVEDSIVNYDDQGFNPAFVVQFWKQEPEHIRRKYPCRTCQSNGHVLERGEDGNWKTCPDCEGTGLDLE